MTEGEAIRAAVIEYQGYQVPGGRKDKKNRIKQLYLRRVVDCRMLYTLKKVRSVLRGSELSPVSPNSTTLTSRDLDSVDARRLILLLISSFVLPQAGAGRLAGWPRD